MDCAAINASGKEVAALQSRQQYLATLAEQRCGAAPPVPIRTVQMAATTAPTAPAPTAFVAPAPASTALTFKASGSDYFTGEVAGTQIGDSIRVSLKTRSARACSYSFDLRPTLSATPTEMLKG